MWLKLYLGNLFVDKVAIDFDEMDTAGERRRHLENHAHALYDDNEAEIFLSGLLPSFFIHVSSEINLPGHHNEMTWKEIIEEVGSVESKQNIEALAHKLSYQKMEEKVLWKK